LSSGWDQTKRDRAESKIDEANDAEHPKSSMSAETNVERKGASVGAVGYYVALRPDVEVLQQLAQVVTEIIDAGSDAQGIAGVYNVGGGPNSAPR
jgi:hypothetical protein